MSRQGSIFYDAPEALGALPLNEEKVVKIFFSLKSLNSNSSPQSESEASSCGDDESHLGDNDRQISMPPQLSKYSSSCFIH